MRSLRAALACVLAALLAVEARADDSVQQHYDCSRIVTLAPSVTETAYALDLGQEIVGVSKYSDFPPAAKSKPRVGALLDPNFEAIVALKPTLVLALSEFRDKIPYLETLSIRVLTFEHRTIDGIVKSIETLGAACRRQRKARLLLDGITRRIEDVRSRVEGRARPRTMVVVGESTGDGALRSLFLSGTDGFYDNVLEIAGGVNVVRATTLGISGVSAEGVIALNPDVIIEIAMAHGLPARDLEAVKRSWQRVGEIPAVKNSRVHVIASDYIAVPGPRFPEVVEEFARYLHPEAFSP